MSAPNDTATPLVEISGLKVHYPLRGGLLRRVTGQVRAVDDVSLTITRGQTVGLVGESGSGKTTLGRALVKLAPITAGTIRYDGQDVTGLRGRAFLPWRKRMQMIFQDPFNSLNPRMTIESVLREPLDLHFPQLSRDERRDRCAALLKRVGLAPDHLARYPHQFSGGQRQRIGIARALAVEPEFIICDEAVSALDVSVQAQIVNLLQDLQEELGLTYLFIAHDLAIVEHISDQVIVMNRGKVVEAATPDELYQNPKDAYTRRLLEAIPEPPPLA